MDSEDICGTFYEFILLDTYLEELNPIYDLLIKEKAFLEELIYMFYYPSAMNGDIIFLKILEDSSIFIQKRFCYYTPRGFFTFKKTCAFLDIPMLDLRIGRTYKRYSQFLVKTGLVGSPQETLSYMKNLKIFSTALILGQNKCYDPETLFFLIKKLNSDIIKIQQKDFLLSEKYIFECDSMRKKKNYF